MKNIPFNQLYSVLLLVCTFGCYAVTATELSLKIGKRNKNLYLEEEHEYITSPPVENVIKDLNHYYSRIRRDSGALNSDTCVKGHDCDINKNLTYPHCYCDGLCRKLNDCCYNFKSGGDVTLEKPNLASVRQFLRCRHDVIIESWDSTWGVYMVSVCPGSFYNESLANKCNLSKENDIPVTDDNGIVYANRYCALCHGAKSFRDWKVVVKAYMDDTMGYMVKLLENSTEFSNFDLNHFRRIGIQVAFLPPRDSTYRICYTNQHLSPVLDYISCSGYLNPVQVIFNNFTKQIYHNFHCLTALNNILLYRCVANIVLYGKQGLKKEQYPLTAIFSVREETRWRHTFHHALNKSTNNDNSKTIQREDCFQSGTNEKLLAENYPIKFSLVYVSNSPVTKNTANRLLSFILSCFPDGLIKLALSRYFYGLRNNSFIDGKTIQNIVKISFDGIITKPLKLSDIKTVQDKLNAIEISYVEKTKLGNTSDIIYLQKENKSFENENPSYIWLHQGVSNSYMIKTILSFIDETKITRSTCIPLNCSIQTLVSYNSMSEITDIDLIKHQCDFEDRGDLTDPDYLEDKTLEFGIFFIQTVTTYVCLCLSTFGAFNTFALFQKLDLFKTTAGVISRNILIVIFSFNVFFMFGIGLNEYPVLCFVAGVITHYLALSYFLWITIFVIHTVYTIKTVKTYRKSNQNDKTKSLHMRICLLGYIGPIIVVLPSVVIDSCNCTDIEIGYSGSICFPTTFPFNLVVFIVPTGICILINIICLLYSILVLSKLNNFMIHEGLQKSRSYVVVFFRMCGVSAISWVLGIISGVFSNIVIEFCFIILSGLHGFIICICLLSTKVFRDAFQTYRNRNTKSGTEIEMIGPGVIENNASSKSNQA